LQFLLCLQPAYDVHILFILKNDKKNYDHGYQHNHGNDGHENYFVFHTSGFNESCNNILLGIFMTDDKAYRKRRIHKKIQRNKRNGQAVAAEHGWQQVNTDHERDYARVENKQSNADPEHQVSGKVQNLFRVQYLYQKQADGYNEEYGPDGKRVRVKGRRDR
jgi:hypothetical protein